MALRELHLFAGCGGGILGGILLGHVPVCAVELEEYPRKVLLRRQQDGILPWFPIWDDVRTFDGSEWRGKVDVVCGGFPCQDISSAGKGAGLDGERSGLWFEMARIVGEVRPRYVFVENSPLLVSRGLDRVLSDFAEMGYDATWGIVSAANAGAPHMRKRIWILADSSRRRRSTAQERQIQQPRRTQTVSTSSNASLVSHADGINRRPGTSRQDGQEIDHGSWWEVEPRLGRVANGVTNRVDRIKALGNAQVPAVAALAFQTLTQEIER